MLARNRHQSVEVGRDLRANMLKKSRHSLFGRDCESIFSDNEDGSGEYFDAKTMAKAYADDLRRKFIEAHQQGEGSLEVLAQRFHVSVGWAKKVSATFRRSGSWARPASGRRGPRSKFTAEIRRQVGAWIEEQPDLTLHELQSRLHDELRLRASIGRLWSLLRELELRLKKSRSTPPSKTPQPADSDVHGGGNK